MKTDAQLGFSFCYVSSLCKPICRDHKTCILSRIHSPWLHSPVGTPKVCLTNAQFYYWFNQADNEAWSSWTLLLNTVLFIWNKSEKGYSINNLVFFNIGNSNVIMVILPVRVFWKTPEFWRNSVTDSSASHFHHLKG